MKEILALRLSVAGCLPLDIIKARSQINSVFSSNFELCRGCQTRPSTREFGWLSNVTPPSPIPSNPLPFPSFLPPQVFTVQPGMQWWAEPQVSLGGRCQGNNHIKEGVITKWDQFSGGKGHGSNKGNNQGQGWKSVPRTRWRRSSLGAGQEGDDGETAVSKEGTPRMPRRRQGTESSSQMWFFRSQMWPSRSSCPQRVLCYGMALYGLTIHYFGPPESVQIRKFLLSLIGETGAPWGPVPDTQHMFVRSLHPWHLQRLHFFPGISLVLCAAPTGTF